MNRNLDRIPTTIALLGIISLGACAERAEPSARDTFRPEPPALAAAAGDCLAPLADAQLTAAQAKAQTATPRERAAAWVSVGHAFVRIARTQTTPELYRNVEGCAARALQAAPDDPDALHLRALVMMDGHRFGEARALALRLLERDRDNVGAWGLLSDAALELGSLDEAKQAAQRMLDLKPSLLSYGRAAHLRFLEGDTAGALQMYSLAISAGRHLVDREPSAWMMVQAALVFLSKGDLAGADAGFEAALREVPGYEPALDGQRQVKASL